MHACIHAFIHAHTHTHTHTHVHAHAYHGILSVNESLNGDDYLSENLFQVKKVFQDFN